jgi:hypothetical protein
MTADASKIALISGSVRVRLDPLSNGLSSNTKHTLDTTQTRTLLASLENDVLLPFRIDGLWLKDAIGAAVLAMVVWSSTTIGSIFGQM